MPCRQAEIRDRGSKNVVGEIDLSWWSMLNLQNAGPITNWDHVSFQTADSSKDSDCMVDPSEFTLLAP